MEQRHMAAAAIASLLPILLLSLVILAPSGPAQTTIYRTITVTTTALMATTITRTVTVTATTTVFTATTAPATTPPAAGWRTVATFSGVDDKTTDSFRIDANRFRLRFETASSGSKSQYILFSIRVYRVGEELWVSWIDFNKVGSDVSYVYSGPGDYYLKILAANLDAWSVEVQVEA